MFPKSAEVGGCFIRPASGVTVLSARLNPDVLRLGNENFPRVSVEFIQGSLRFAGSAF